MNPYSLNRVPERVRHQYDSLAAQRQSQALPVPGTQQSIQGIRDFLRARSAATITRHPEEGPGEAQRAMAASAMVAGMDDRQAPARDVPRTVGGGVPAEYSRSSPSALPAARTGNHTPPSGAVDPASESAQPRQSNDQLAAVLRSQPAHSSLASDRGSGGERVVGRVQLPEFEDLRSADGTAASVTAPNSGPSSGKSSSRQAGADRRVVSVMEPSEVTPVVPGGHVVDGGDEDNVDVERRGPNASGQPPRTRSPPPNVDDARLSPRPSPRQAQHSGSRGASPPPPTSPATGMNAIFAASGFGRLEMEADPTTSKRCQAIQAALAAVRESRDQPLTRHERDLLRHLGAYVETMDVEPESEDDETASTTTKAVRAEEATSPKAIVVGFMGSPSRGSHMPASINQSFRSFKRIRSVHSVSMASPSGGFAAGSRNGSITSGTVSPVVSSRDDAESEWLEVVLRFTTRCAEQCGIGERVQVARAVQNEIQSVLLVAGVAVTVWVPDATNGHLVSYSDQRTLPLSDRSEEAISAFASGQVQRTASSVAMPMIASGAIVGILEARYGQPSSKQLGGDSSLCTSATTALGGSTIAQQGTMSNALDPDSEAATLIDAMAAIAAPFLHNATLFEDVVRTRRQSDVMLRMARLLTTDALEETTLVNTIIMAVSELVDADRCSVFIVGEDRKTLRAFFEDTSRFVEMPIDSGIAGHVARTGETINLTDAYDDARFNGAVDKATGYRTRSLLCMPVAFESRTVAVAQLVNKKPLCIFGREIERTFSKADEALFNSLAVYVGVCLRNCRANADLEAQRHRNETALRVASLMSRTDIRHLSRVIHQILQGAKALLFADRATLFLVDKEKNDLYSDKEFNTEGVTIRVKKGSGIVGQVAKTGKAVNVPDAYRDARFNQEIDKQFGYHTVSIIAEPIYGPTGEVIAVAQLINKIDKGLPDLSRSYRASLARGANVSPPASPSPQPTLGDSSPIPSFHFPMISTSAAPVESSPVQALSHSASMNVDRDSEGTTVAAGGGDSVNTGLDTSNHGPPSSHHSNADLLTPGGGTSTKRFIPFNTDDHNAFKQFALFAGMALSNARLLEFAVKAAEDAVKLSQKGGGEFRSDRLAASGMSRSGRRHSTLREVRHDSVEADLQNLLQTTLTDEEVVSAKLPDFNLFRFRRMHGDAAPDKCSRIVCQLIWETGLPVQFGCEMSTLMRFVLACRSRYRHVPYHNWFHAVDVCQTVHHFLYTGKCADSLQPLECFVLLVVALVHDLDHMGLNNSYHFKTESPLGILSSASGNTSVLEVHHCNLAIEILDDKATDVFAGLASDRRALAIRTLIDCVLATDMAKHGELVDAIEKTLGGDVAYDEANDSHRRLAMLHITKAADISNVTKPFDVSRLWGASVTEEFYRQGDMEKEKGVDVLPMNDRSLRTELAKGQIGFINFMARKYFLAVTSKLFPQLQYTVDGIEANASRWQEELDLADIAHMTA